MADDLLDGRSTLSTLTVEERLVANAELDGAIDEATRQVDFGAVLAAEGLTAVAVDDEGRNLPDGRTVPVD